MTFFEWLASKFGYYKPAPKPQGRVIGRCENCGGNVFLGKHHIHNQDTYHELNPNDHV